MTEASPDLFADRMTAPSFGPVRGSIFRDLGVEPVINCAWVRTQYGGSNPAPEVLAAMADAAQSFVDLDELAECVGTRLSALTGAEWGIVTSSTTAALALATAACIAGNNPELMLRLPRTEGLARRVIMLSGQRFDYDHAILAAGAQIDCAHDYRHLEQLLYGPAVMICLLARQDRHVGIPLQEIVPLARRRNVPILVDAAGLSPDKPDPWLEAGADLVVYAGGKYLRGPQSTGLLLGRKDLCKAAWLNGPPHQALGRSMKVGKEEVVGAVVALDRWLNSAAAATERARWVGRLESIESHFCGLSGVTTRMLPSSKFVTAPRLRIQWNPAAVHWDSAPLRAALLQNKPRILIHDFWSSPDSIVIDPVNLTDSEATVIAITIRDFLLTPCSQKSSPKTPALIDIGGSWRVRLRFLHGEAEHALQLQQQGEQISGQHIATYSTGSVNGAVHGGLVSFTARHETSGLALYYGFEGRLIDEVLVGKLVLGAASDEHSGPVFQQQFGEGGWSAQRDGSA
jgi:D-glucosaminate-6-phosphate ammonia-lyase